MPSLATKNDRVTVIGIFALGLVAGGAFALTTDIPVTVVMVAFAVIFTIQQYLQR